MKRGPVRPLIERQLASVRFVTFKPQLRRASADDGADILAIYNESIERGEIARHSRSLTMTELASALLPNEHRYHTYVAPMDGVVQGWAGFRPWHPRGAYASTLELLVYVTPMHRGRGLGKALVRQTIAAAASAEFHSIVALCQADDSVAARLLRSTGFVELGRPRAVFPALGGLRDVMLYQRLLYEGDGR